MTEIKNQNQSSQLANITGVSGKWLELLKQLAPRVTRAAVLRGSTVSSGTAQFAAIQAVAPSLGVR